MNAAASWGHSLRRGALGSGLFAVLLTGALAAAALAGCGLKTAPQPELRAAPPLLKVWQRDRDAAVAWSMPLELDVDRFEGLEGFVLALRRFPQNCLACEPLEERAIRLAPGDAAMRVEVGWAFFFMPLPEQPEEWQFRVGARYGGGATPFSRVAILRGRVNIPAHTLAWEWVPLPGNRGQPAIFRRVQLRWPLRRERIARTVSKQGSLVEHEEFYRANIYRRIAGRAWPLWPLNKEPVAGSQHFVSVPTGTPAEPAPRIEFSLRLVDQFGNEGPATAPVSPVFNSGKS